MITPQYLAGLIDGEGYVALLPSRAKGLKVTSYEPVIKIGMTGIESFLLFSELREQYGGHIDSRAKLSKGGREVYVYILKSKKRVNVLLKDIYPYLRIKQPQATLLREFCDMASSHTRYKTFDNGIVLRKDEIFNLLKLLKQPPATTE